MSRLGLLLLAIALTACTTIETGSMCIADESYFEGRRSLAWAEDFAQITNDPLDAIAPVTLEQIRMQVEAEFRTLGFDFTDASQADMIVSFVVATHTEVTRDYYATHGTYWWGVYGRPSVMVQTAEQRKEAFLAIDLAEAGTNRALWRGWAEKPVYPADRNDPTPLIREAVASILTELPGAAKPAG